MEDGDKQSVDGQRECLQGETLDILAPTTKSLVAIGAAAALNCHRCLSYLVPTAVQNGVLIEEIEAAIAVVKGMRGHAAGSTDKLVNDLLLQQGAEGEQKRDCC